MKHEKISIKWKVFLYLLVFVLVLLVALWLVQTVYLDTFYKTIKTQELDKAMSNVEKVLQSDDMESNIDSIADSYDIGVMIVDDEGKEIYTSEAKRTYSAYRLSGVQIQSYLQQARENGGKLKFKTGDKKKEMPQFGMLDKGMDRNPDDFKKFRANGESESMIFVKIVNLPKEQTGGVFLSSHISPVNATVQTLRVQLCYISGIVVILSLVIAFWISKRFSRSIIRVNESAKELAKGDFEVEFDGRDYKEIAELSNTLNHTVEELAKAENLQKELIANVSHDLRTPLTMIIAYSEVMRDLPGENTPENVQVVIDEAKRLTNLVNDLLDVSKLQAGVTSLQIDEYDLTKSIISVINRYAKLVEQDGYQISFSYDHHVLVEADKYKIYQVIYNLINNAVNYTGEDKKVTVKQIANGNIVRIEVADTGFGIAKEELKNVWERYYKVDKNHKRAVMGTGLGLSIVKNILKLHQAQYGVSSEQGTGSTFWFELKMKGNRDISNGSKSI